MVSPVLPIDVICAAHDLLWHVVNVETQAIVVPHITSIVCIDA